LYKRFVSTFYGAEREHKQKFPQSGSAEFDRFLSLP
jgi:hypothetical protein